MGTNRKKILEYLRYDLPLWLVRTLTNWWPDVGAAIRLRGKLFSPFIGKCGGSFTVGRDVTILVPGRLTVGDNVYLAKGTWIEASGTVQLEDEVIFGPYVVVVSTKHGFSGGSARFGGVHPAPVKIGRGSWLAAHVVVAAGVTIGRGNLVGANAVVTRDTPDDVFVGGVPAKVIRPRQDNPSEVHGRRDI